MPRLKSRHSVRAVLTAAAAAAPRVASAIKRSGDLPPSHRHRQHQRAYRYTNVAIGTVHRRRLPVVTFRTVRRRPS